MLKYIYPVSGNIYAYLFGRPAFNALNNFLHYLSLRGLGYLNYKNKSISGEYSFAKKYIEGLYERNNAYRMTIFDVGANKGQYLSSLGDFYKKFPIEFHAFEPSLSAFEELKKNFGNKELISLNNIGLSNFNGEASLYDYFNSENNDPGTQHASLDRQVIEIVHKSKSISSKVYIQKGDSYCEQNNIIYIDLLKIDVEGEELEVIKGFGRMIKERRIGCIQFEFAQTMIPSRLQITDFMQVLPEFNFFRLLPSGGSVPIERRHYPVYFYHNIVCFPTT